jgi:hypothetical protein
MRQAIGDRRLRVRRQIRPVHGLQQEMPELQPLEKRRLGASAAETPASARRQRAAPEPLRPSGSHRSSPGLAGGSCVPLVSTATRKPRACSAAVSAASTCSKGSPPVSTTRRSPAPPCQCASTASASASADANRPPPSPPMPTNDVSQKRHTAVARSASRPLHRLHPANRQNTAAWPACAPFALQGQENLMHRINADRRRDGTVHRCAASPACQPAFRSGASPRPSLP